MSALVRRINQIIPSSARSFLKGMLFRVKNRGFEPYVTEFERDGARIRFYVGDHVGDAWQRGGWDWTEIDFLRDHMVREGDVVLECGAHHGELTIFLSRWVGPSGRVIAFEPVPRNAEIIRKQIELNNLANVTLVNAAVGPAPGKVRITDESNAQVSKSSGVEVDVVRLDDYLHENPTMLKIDVEGFEAELLKGAQQMLKSHPRVSIEIHTPSLPRYGTSVEEVLSLVHADRYEWRAQYSGGESVRRWDGETHGRVVHLFGTPKKHVEAT